MLHCCLSWDPALLKGASRWIKQKFLLPPSGQSLRPVSNCNVFLDFPSFHSFYLLQSTFLVHTSTRRVAFVRSRFCFASILLVPDLGCQFVVEVDSSDVGFGAMLSQWPTTDQKRPLCAFFLSCMTPAERNYLNGNFWGQDSYAASACWHCIPTTSYLVDHKVWLSQKVGPMFHALITNEKTVNLGAVKRPRSMWFHPNFQVLRVSPMREWLWQFHFLHLLTLLMLDRLMDFQRAAMFRSLGKWVPVFAGLEERSRILAHHILSPAYITDFMQGHLKVAEMTTFSPRDHDGGVGPRKVVFASSLPICCLSNFLLPHSVTLWVITAWITYPG